jgi:chromosome segregation ATPase
MQSYGWTAAACAAFLLAVQGAALAADTDVRASREREMLKRTQEALRQSQAQNAELTAQLAAQRVTVEKQADEKLKAAAAQLDSTRKASRSAQAALQAQIQSAASRQTELTTLLADANRQLNAIAAKQQATAGELRRTQDQLKASKASNTDCEAKNLQLYQYSQELMTRYQKKGVWAALAQKEPTGIKEVSVENLLQEYQQKLDAQRIKPALPP